MTIKTPHIRRRPLIVSAGVAVAVAAGLASASPAGAAPSASVANDTLTVTGSSGNDTLVLRVQAATPNVLEVDFGGDGTAEFDFDRSTFSKVAVTLASGRDAFSIDRGAVSLADETMTIDGGSGDDNLTGSNAVEVFIGGSGRDFVDGNQGNDTGIMGSGDDTFRWDPGDGSDIVEGESGRDTMDFNGAAGARGHEPVARGRPGDLPARPCQHPHGHGRRRAARPDRPRWQRRRHSERHVRHRFPAG